MKVFCYDAEKRVFVIEMALLQVVRCNIHPWRLDLFDPNPIKMVRRGKELFFSRLDNISFAYLIENPAMFGRDARNLNVRWTDACFGQVAKGIKICCQGKREAELNSGPSTATSLALPKVDIVPFTQRWLHYLTLSPHGKAVGYEAYAALEGKHIYLRRGRAVYAYEPSEKGREIGNPAFAGEMFAEIRLQRALSPKINVVFSHFAEWHPIVYGGALSDSLRKTQLRNINFMVDRHEPGILKGKLAEVGAINIVDCSSASGSSADVVFQFELDGTPYQMVSRGNVLVNRFWEANDFSVTQAIARRADEIIASRICLWDIGHGQTRYIARYNPSRTELRSPCFSPYRADKLRGRGFRVMPNVFDSGR